jgi:two-component system nitrate/nitrite response regulator NarL
VAIAPCSVLGCQIVLKSTNGITYRGRPDLGQQTFQELRLVMGTPLPSIRVFVVSNVRLHRDGLAQALLRYGQLEVVGTAPASAEVPEEIREQRPDAVLLDNAIAGGLSMVRAIVEQVPSTKVVVFAVAEADAQVIACAEAGAAAYVPTDASVEDLVVMLESAVRGELMCSPRVAATLFNRLATLASARENWHDRPPLTGREVEIMRLIDQGLSNKEIGRRLSIETATVKNHVHNILEKLHVHRRGEAAAYARRSALSARR